MCQRCRIPIDQVDWSTNYKLFSRAEWKARELFLPAMSETLKHIEGDYIPLAGDETRTRRGGRKVKRSRWTRDPMSPPFHTNFMKGIRWVQFCVLLPLHHTHDISARGIPISFEPVDLPPKPARNATEEQKEEYKKEKSKNSMAIKTVKQLKQIRQMYDQIGAQAKTIVAALDGGFCNRTMFQAVFDRIILVVRARKDASLCFPANDPGHPKRVYSQEKFTPEQVRKDESIPWQKMVVWFGGARREIKYKTLDNILWQRVAKRKRLRLIVIAATPYRLSPCMPRYYRQPAFLIIDKPELPMDIALQTYFDRWQIEVNHRDEKQDIRITDAQVWNDKSVDRLPAFMVASYSYLLLASLNAFGPERTNDYLQPAIWQRKTSAKRPSCLDLLAKLREDALHSPDIDNLFDFDVDTDRILLRAA